MSAARTISQPATRGKAIALVALLLISILAISPRPAGAQSPELTSSDLAFISYEVTIDLLDVEDFSADERVSIRYGGIIAPDADTTISDYTGKLNSHPRLTSSSFWDVGAAVDPAASAPEEPNFVVTPCLDGEVYAETTIDWTPGKNDNNNSGWVNGQSEIAIYLRVFETDDILGALNACDGRRCRSVRTLTGPEDADTNGVAECEGMSNYSWRTRSATEALFDYVPFPTTRPAPGEWVSGEPFTREMEANIPNYGSAKLTLNAQVFRTRLPVVFPIITIFPFFPVPGESPAPQATCPDAGCPVNTETIGQLPPCFFTNTCDSPPITPTADPDDTPAADPSDTLAPPPADRICDGQIATIVGTSGDDDLVGTDGPDVIAALQGNDTIRGLGGDDIICAGTGNDRVYGGAGFDVLFGAQGDDELFAANGSSETARADTSGARMFGGSGDDIIHGTNRWDRMQGGTGADRLYGHEGRDWMRGGADEDFVEGGIAIDDLHGGNANDTLIVNGADDVRGGAGLQDTCHMLTPAGSIRSCEIQV